MNLISPLKHAALFIIWAIISLLLFIGCNGFSSDDKPENLISEDTYINVLVELQLIRTHHNALPDSVNADSLTQIIYEKYEIEEDQFLSSHKYYQKQVESQLRRTDEAISRLENEQDRIEAWIDSLRADTRVDSLQADTTRIDTTQIDSSRMNDSQSDTTAEL